MANFVSKIQNINPKLDFSQIKASQLQPVVRCIMQPQRNSAKLIVGLLIGLLVIFIEGIRLLSSDLLSSAAQSRPMEISSLLQQQQSLAAIDAERRATTGKVVGIISRYNKTMSEETKKTIAGEIYQMSRKYPNLDVDFICATITHESAKTWDPTVESRAGAMGLMQIMPTTGAYLALQEGMEWTTANQILHDPVVNIRLGCRYLSELVTMYKQDGGLAAYNGGPKRAEIWIASNRNQNTLVNETRNYVPAILKLYDQFRTEGVM
jgi:soluble lytic murein transglycosylase-like protein